jgi:anti-sigma-K factor RskA
VSASPEGHPLDDVAAYALGALEGDERHALEAHLLTCPACQAELAGHHEALARLTPDAAPPPALWERIVANLPAEPAPAAAPPAALRPAPPAGATSAAPAPAGADGARPAPAGRPGTAPAHLAPRRRRGWQRALAGMAAAAAVAAVAVGATLVVTAEDTDDGEPPVAAPPAPADVASLAEAALDDPTSLAVLATDRAEPRARLVTAEAGAFVVLDRLPTLPAGRAYQLWSLDGAAPVSLGVLGDGARRAVAVALPAGTTQVAISDAPAAGEVRPTGPIVATGAVEPA